MASNGEDWSWHIGGSWLWRVAYLAGLCLLAAIGACAHGTEGAQRRRLARAATVVARRHRRVPAARRVHRHGGLLRLGQPVRTAPLAELGAVRWGPVAGALAAAAALAVLDLTVWPRGPGSELGALVAGLLGGAAALALDDPAAGVTRAVPTTRRRRTAIRLVVAAGGSGRGACTSRGRPTRCAADGLPVSWLTLVVIGSGVVALCVGAAVRARAGAGTGSPGRWWRRRRSSGCSG